MGSTGSNKEAPALIEVQQMVNEELAAKMSQVSSRTIGYCRRGGTTDSVPVVAAIASDLSDEKVSFCGVKGFMIDEVREFTLPREDPETIACAMVAVLEITNSPVHVHSLTRRWLTCNKAWSWPSRRATSMA